MADVANQLADGYLAVKREVWSTEVVTTDGGGEHRNQRWSAPLAEWDVTVPFCKRSSSAYVAATALIFATKGSLRTFTFHDPIECEDVEVRILDDTMAFVTNGNLVQIEFSVRQIRSGNSP